MSDYDNRKENQAFEHVELLQRQRESSKRADDYDDRAWQNAADHVDAIKRCKAKPVRRKTKTKRLVIGSISHRHHDYAVQNDADKFDLKNGNDTPNAYKVACVYGLLRYV